MKVDTYEDSAYWKDFSAGLPLLQLPFSKGYEVEQGNPEILPVTIEGDEAKQINALSAHHNCNVTVFFIAAFKALLFRYTHHHNLCIALADELPPDKSLHPGFDELIMYSEVSGSDSFITILQKVKKSFCDSWQHRMPFSVINELFDGANHNNINAINQILLLHRHAAEEEALLEEQAGILTAYARQFDLIFTLTETCTSFKCSAAITRNVYDWELLASFLNHLPYLVKAVLHNPEQPVGALNILSPDEEHLLSQFNNTGAEYPLDKTPVMLFEEQTAQTPDNIALLKQEEAITYSELNKRANQIARHLIKSGLKPRDNVGLLVSRSFDMVTFMLAILKAGGAYVPVEPEYPEARQEYILRNSGVSLVLADETYPVESIMQDIQFIKIDRDSTPAEDAENLNLEVDTNDLAYTIYTSGSTGRPKGVMIAHHSAVNLVLAMNQKFGVDQSDRVLCVTSMCFDLSVYDIFGMLATGGSIVIAVKEEVTDFNTLQLLLQKYSITIWNSVPSTLNNLTLNIELFNPHYQYKNLKNVFLSGDWIPVSLPSRINKFFPSARVISLGGATEATVWSNYYLINEVKSTWKSIPYGKPLANNLFYILNEHLQPVPAGVTGELYIGGAGVAKGYCNEADKTNYSFVPDPINTQYGNMYRTGDLGRMMPDYNMEFLGRRDTQVKINGYRIELGEIEAAIEQTGMVTEAVVVAKETVNQEKQLLSFFVPKASFTKEAIYTLLTERLPAYMVPNIWVTLEKMPLTSNGKIDKKVLLDFDYADQLKSQYVAPEYELENQLTEIWQTNLGVKQIGVNDNFFELGGTSLLAAKTMTQIEKLTGKRLSISNLFNYPTIKQIADLLSNLSVIKYKSLVPLKSAGSKVPLYIIHGIGLDILNFRNIIRHLDADQPIYGLQALGLDGESEQLNSIEEIAAFYNEEIISQNPTGPYAIAGYSIGGYIGFEMAKQLQAMGKEVKMLAVLDSYLKPADQNLLIKKIYRSTFGQLPKLIFRIGSFARYPSENVVYLKNKYKRSSAKTEEDRFDELYHNHESAPEYIKRIVEKLLSARDNYAYEACDIEVHIIKARKTFYYYDKPRMMGWKNYALKGISVHYTPGNHLEMLNPPNDKPLARILQNLLNEIS